MAPLRDPTHGARDAFCADAERFTEARDTDIQTTVTAERQSYSGWLSVTTRDIRFDAPRTGPAPASAALPRTADFDVLGHPKCNFTAVAVVPFHPAGQDGDGAAEPCVTLIREYHWGPDRYMYGPIMGGFDPKKHTSREECALAEMSEEARLTRGEWLCMTPERGISETKWCANGLHGYLVVAPTQDAAPLDRDREEVTLTVERVPVSQLRPLMFSGALSTPGVAFVTLALMKLRSLGLLQHDPFL